MKQQIRKGVFETNSSSEHSLTVMNRDKFNDWKDGKLLARRKSISEDQHTWGNFWSCMMIFEFTDDFEQAKKDNDKIIEDYKQYEVKHLIDYKEKCLNHKKLIEKELSEDELIDLSAKSPKDADEYIDKLYEDSLYRFNEDHYNQRMDLLNNINFETFGKNFGLTNSKIWMTFDEFWNDFIESGDCESPFEHDDEENNVHIIGKYYHS